MTLQIPNKKVVVAEVGRQTCRSPSVEIGKTPDQSRCFAEMILPIHSNLAWDVGS